MIEYCADKDTNCWIGLVISNGQISWIDGTDVDEQFVNASLCQRIDLSTDNITEFEYFGYINTTSNCWQVTSNSSHSFSAACGPPRFDPTNTYFICISIIPGLLSLIIFSYSFYCIIFLINHLFVNKYNYANEESKPSLSIKITAILSPILLNIISLLLFSGSIMLYTSYKRTGILSPVVLIDPYYPREYISVNIILLLALLFYFLYFPLGYINVCHLCDYLPKLTVVHLQNK